MMYVYVECGETTDVVQVSGAAGKKIATFYLPVNKVRQFFDITTGESENSSEDDTPLLLSVAEAASKIGVSAVTAYKWINEGRIKSVLAPHPDSRRIDKVKKVERAEVERIKRELAELGENA